jgi:hypothetical protein
MPVPLSRASEASMVCEGKDKRPAVAPVVGVSDITVCGSAGKPTTTVCGLAGKPTPRSRRCAYRRTVPVSFSPGGPWSPVFRSWALVYRTAPLGRIHRWARTCTALPSTTLNRRRWVRDCETALMASAMTHWGDWSGGTGPWELMGFRRWGRASWAVLPSRARDHSKGKNCGSKRRKVVAYGSRVVPPLGLQEMNPGEKGSVTIPMQYGEMGPWETSLRGQSGVYIRVKRPSSRGDEKGVPGYEKVTAGEPGYERNGLGETGREDTPIRGPGYDSRMVRRTGGEIGAGARPGHRAGTARILSWEDERQREPGHRDHITGRPGHHQVVTARAGCEGFRSEESRYDIGTTRGDGPGRNRLNRPGRRGCLTGRGINDSYETGESSPETSFRARRDSEIERHLSREPRYRSPSLDRGMRTQEDDRAPWRGSESPYRYRSCLGARRGGPPVDRHSDEEEFHWPGGMRSGQRRSFMDMEELGS